MLLSAEDFLIPDLEGLFFGEHSQPHARYNINNLIMSQKISYIERNLSDNFRHIYFRLGQVRLGQKKFSSSKKIDVICLKDQKYRDETKIMNNLPKNESINFFQELRKAKENATVIINLKYKKSWKFH